jgi:hypothetical protein
MRIVLFVAACALTGLAGAGGQPPDTATRWKAAAPFVDGQTFAVLRLDLTRPDVEELVLALGGINPRTIGVLSYLPEENLRRLGAGLRKAGVKELYALESFADRDELPLLVLSAPGGAAEPTLAAVKEAFKALPDVAAERNGGVVLLARKAVEQRYRKFQAVPRPEFGAALAAVGDATLQMAVALSPEARRAFEEIIPHLPAELGGGPSSLLTQGIRWVGLGLDGAPKARLQGVIQASDLETAAKLHQWLAGAFAKLDQAPELRKTVPIVELIAGSLQPAPAGDRLLLKLDGQNMEAAMGPLLGKGRQAAERKKALTSLQQLALAMHAYADAHKSFPPPAIYDKQGKPLLSWRVALLPYLEQRPLYNQFKLDEPWDSPHNKKLIAQMPAVYRQPGNKGLLEGKTPFLVPVGKDTIFPGGKGIQFKDITDGTSNTALIFEAADDNMVVWTRPEDLPFDPKDPHRGLLSKGRDSFGLALADGSVRTVPSSISAKTLRNVIMRNDGEPLGDDF